MAGNLPELLDRLAATDQCIVYDQDWHADSLFYSSEISSHVWTLSSDGGKYMGQDQGNSLTITAAPANGAVNAGYWWLFFDYPNIPAVLRNNKPVQEYEYDCDSENGVIKVCRESSLNLIEGLREQRWIFHMPDGKELVHDTSLKMYLPDAIVESLQLCGFVDVEVFGSVFGDPLELDSERCIFIARRPSA